MIADKEATYKGQQRVKMVPPNLNSLNYKVCHVEPVGIGYGEIERIDIDVLKSHMYTFLSISNIFLIPKEYGPLAELESFVDVFKDADKTKKIITNRLP